MNEWMNLINVSCVVIRPKTEIVSGKFSPDGSFKMTSSNHVGWGRFIHSSFVHFIGLKLKDLKRRTYRPFLDTSRGLSFLGEKYLPPLLLNTSQFPFRNPHLPTDSLRRSLLTHSNYIQNTLNTVKWNLTHHTSMPLWWLPSMPIKQHRTFTTVVLWIMETLKGARLDYAGKCDTIRVPLCVCVFHSNSNFILMIKIQRQGTRGTNHGEETFSTPYL